jgi:hypothetical protein
MRQAGFAALRKRSNLSLLSAIRRVHCCVLRPCMSAILGVVAPAAMVLLLCLPASAQAPSQTPEARSAPTERPYVLTVNARLVVLDVVVTDKAGKSVDGLTAKDFQIFEDGKPQHIRSLRSALVSRAAASFRGCGHCRRL